MISLEHLDKKNYPKLSFVRSLRSSNCLSVAVLSVTRYLILIWLQTVVSRLITHKNRSFSRPPKEQKYCFCISQCLSISLEHLDKKKNYPKVSFVRSLRSSNCTSHKSWTYTLKYKQCCLIISELRSTSIETVLVPAVEYAIELFS